MKISGDEDADLQKSVIQQEFRVRLEESNRFWFSGMSLRILMTVITLLMTVSCWVFLATNWGRLSLPTELLIGLFSLAALYSMLTYAIGYQVVTITKDDNGDVLQISFILLGFRTRQMIIPIRNIETVFEGLNSQVFILSKSELFARLSLKSEDLPLFVRKIAESGHLSSKELKPGSTITVGDPMLHRRIGPFTLEDKYGHVPDGVSRVWNKKGELVGDKLIVLEGWFTSPQVSFNEGKEAEPESFLAKFIHRTWIVGLIALLIFLMYVAVTMK